MKKKPLSLLLLMVLSLVTAACAAAAPAEELAQPFPGGAAEANAPTVSQDQVFIEEEPAEEEEMAEEEAAQDFFDEDADELLEPITEGGEAAVDGEEPAAPLSPESQSVQPIEPPSDVFFEEYGTNSFVQTATDNLSTFAVDVDSGSYTLTRTYLNEGFAPPPEAIRLEEFVNYFEQDYLIPQQNAFALYTETAPTPYNAEGNYVMRVGVQGYEVAPEDRPDANLIFVIDVSGSMEGPERLGAVKTSLETLVDELRPTDSVGIVVYGSQGRVILEPTPVSQRRQILRAIRRLETEGSTNAEDGLRLGYELATAYFDDEHINKIILCSDGVANVGETGPDAILEVVRRQAREGITLTSVGFGVGNYNDVLMEQLANDGDGQYFYVDSQAEAERVFVDDLTSTLQTIALDAKIQVEFNPETVAFYRLMGYENRDVADQDFRNDDVDAGEIGAGHSVTALYEVVPVAQSSGSLATIHLRWEDPETGEVTEIEHLATTQDVVSKFEDASDQFQLDASVVAFADVLGQGAWAQSTDLDQISEIMVPVARSLGNDPEVAEFVGLVELAKQVR